MQHARELIRENGDSADKALLAACKEGVLDVVVCLVKELGADVNAYRSDELQTPLRIASEKGHHLLIRTLVMELGVQLQESALHIAVLRGQHQAARVLARELGANVGARNFYGRTPLHFARHSSWSFRGDVCVDGTWRRC